MQTQLVGGQAEGFWRVAWDMLRDVWAVMVGEERQAVHIMLWLAIFNQAMASTAIINYAPQLLDAAGLHSHADATLWTSAVAAAKVLMPPCKAHAS